MRSFSGEYLREVAFPLGGIGTGTVSLGGRGNLQDWEIFNRPGKGRVLPYTFFALWVREQGEEPVCRVLERRLLPPYSGGFGLPTSRVSGLPRLREARFRGEYPFAWIEFEDESLPVRIRLEAFNPFIPLDAEASGIPCALFHWELENWRAVNVEASIAFSLYNACGYDGQAPLSNRHHALFGGNLNTAVQDSTLTGLRMSCNRYPDDHPQFGTMAVATDAQDSTWLTRWERAGWWDDVQAFWDLFNTLGRLPNGPAPESSPDGQTDVGSLAASVLLPAGASARIPFYLAWHFPNRENDWNREEAVRGRRMRNWYATRWPDAWDVIQRAHDRREHLTRTTRLFHDSFFESTLPAEALDAASANASILRTPTCLRTEDGRFHAFEGCHDNAGCCPMNCTHVWNYAMTPAFLFPELERTVRRTDFLHNTRPDGSMAFRTLLPLTAGALWAFKPAADGQMGSILKVYREWLQCGDEAFLREMWPGVQRALEFAWSPGGWDADQDGVMEGEQHNTYDIEFYGPNTLTGTLYLGALRAAEEMALHLGERAKAARYGELFESGRKKQVELLWNGEYFEQRIETPTAEGTTSTEGVGAAHPASIQPGESAPRYQYGPGCLSDHLLGQWFARVVGLGDLLPPENVKGALAAIHRHNFRRDLSSHASVQRVYALNEEAGLLLCTWPRGGRPGYPFPYADEVWTGIEYQVAAHLIYEGMVQEGLEIVRAVRDRHDGLKRNPWNEVECGHHYARAMSSWSLLTALTGCEYNASAQALSFAPRFRAEPFRCFFTAGTAWGAFSLRRTGEALEARIDLQWGELTLRRLGLPLEPGLEPRAAVAGQAFQTERSGGWIHFSPPVRLAPGSALRITA